MYPDNSAEDSFYVGNPIVKIHKQQKIDKQPSKQVKNNICDCLLHENMLRTTEVVEHGWSSHDVGHAAVGHRSCISVHYICSDQVSLCIFNGLCPIDVGCAGNSVEMFDNLLYVSD